jgi:spore coat protein A, manganese oxidase
MTRPFPSSGVRRRTFLKWMGGAAGAAVALGSNGLWLPTRRTQAQASLTPFVDPLPVPPVIAPSGTLNGQPLFNVTMQAITRQLHRDLAPTPLWGYNGLYPGPTFETTRGAPINVKWMNNLPSTQMFPIDDTLHGDEPGQPQVRTVVHLHGAKVEPDSDGYPEAWFTNGFAQVGPFFTNQVYQYPNDQQATLLWYHDHGLGTTRLNIFAGLAGFYFIRDDHESSLNVPKGPYEIPLMIQDRYFNPDGSLFYPVIDTGGDPDQRVPPVWIPEFFGDTVLVNGKVWPLLEVEPRKYRFRMLNASNARWYHLTLNEAAPDGSPNGNPGPAFNIIGTDGGFLPFPAQATEILTAPSERYDIVIDFSGASGKSFVLSNDGAAPFPDGGDVVPDKVMLFKVDKPLSGRDTSSVPRRPGPGNGIDRIGVRTRDLILSELDSADPFGNPIIGRIDARGTRPTTTDPWLMPVTETPPAGATEIWRLINTTGDGHPIHIHLVQFQVLDRQPFALDQIDTSVSPPQIGRLMFTGPRVQPRNETARPYLQYEQNAFKDTVKAFPGEVTRVIMRFILPTGTPVTTGEKFRYVFHCHILEHEDNDMMRPYDVVG